MSERVLSGLVKADGQVARGNGFHVSRKSAGQYLIIFQPPLVTVMRGDVQLMGDKGGTSCGASLRSFDGLHAMVEVRSADGSAIDADFSFVFSGEGHPEAAGVPGVASDPTGVLPDPAIGSPSQPVLNFRQPERTPPQGQAPREPMNRAQVDPVIAAQQEQIHRLQKMMQQVLQPLQAENKMLRSRLDLLKQAQGQAAPPASDLLPVTYGLPAAMALAKLLSAYEFETVLDFGPGTEERSLALFRVGRMVTTLVAPDKEIERLPEDITVRRGDLHTALLPTTFDCIIAAHMLHRQRDPQRFLRRLHDLLPECAILVLTVPALRYPMLHGELSIWSPGLVLYHLVLAGFNCSSVKVLTQGEEISVIIEKDTIDPWVEGTPLPPLVSLRRYLPARVDFVLEPACFNGDIPNLDW
ncbi:class I SAM-dependent methyltransferase [Rhizobium sp. SL86]|uniref:class I SAM-dependent methyltransferase n=1 Tax=Rhizobium sp. SL86 TaxID=2995148 RepID=UPI002273138A|nr:methyltransferase domain-containing protein [Rhizobium sp. SL86]MCY1668665.1 methyltransferase domain-containing protein [Rhizobium sp. SL86]